MEYCWKCRDGFDAKVPHFRLAHPGDWYPFWEHPAAFEFEKRQVGDAAIAALDYLEKLDRVEQPTQHSLGWFAQQWFAKNGYKLVLEA